MPYTYVIPFCPLSLVAYTEQEVGCLFGALSNLWVGDKLGRRRTIVLGGCIMLIGTELKLLIKAPAEFLTGAILQTTAFSFAQLIFSRIFTGYGNGLIVSNVLNMASKFC